MQIEDQNNNAHSHIDTCDTHTREKKEIRMKTIRAQRERESEKRINFLFLIGKMIKRDL